MSHSAAVGGCMVIMDGGVWVILRYRRCYHLHAVNSFLPRNLLSRLPWNLRFTAVHTTALHNNRGWPHQSLVMLFDYCPCASVEHRGNSPHCHLLHSSTDHLPLSGYCIIDTFPALSACSTGIVCERGFKKYVSCWKSIHTTHHRIYGC
ncbi:hypothetical protein OESDEN_23450 [Oesophagostomum dentatum]|uniref:Uncharacterized protein n=1 Tax=Oesophagostomum dentatum TaxID=61180 RepID=A0A0B1S118_OESDE|nr:hypothetical protein OESDEN_23450 [Oesophagostomum dentatum]